MLIPSPYPLSNLPAVPGPGGIPGVSCSRDGAHHWAQLSASCDPPAHLTELPTCKTGLWLLDENEATQ